MPPANNIAVIRPTRGAHASTTANRSQPKTPPSTDEGRCNARSQRDFRRSMWPASMSMPRQTLEVTTLFSSLARSVFSAPSTRSSTRLSLTTMLRATHATHFTRQARRPVRGAGARANVSSLARQSIITPRKGKVWMATTEHNKASIWIACKGHRGQSEMGLESS
eukprot:6197741-Pleurochrysis_carterae.AAC.3